MNLLWRDWIRPRKTGNFKNDSSGFTVLEIIVALFIFGCVSAALLKAMATADRIHGRAMTVMDATAIAENEIERIRKKAAFVEAIGDCTYIASINKREFEVQRLVLIPDSLKFAGKEPSLFEIQVSVKDRAAQASGALIFRLLQGYAR